MSKKIAAILCVLCIAALLAVPALCAAATTEAKADAAAGDTVAASAEDAASIDSAAKGDAGESTEDKDAEKEQPVGLVIGMGVGVVFFGLVCIVILCKIMSAIIRAVEKKLPEKESAAPQSAIAAPSSSELSPEKRREIIAAVSAVIALMA